MSKFDIYVKVSILIKYKTKQLKNLAWNISLPSLLCDMGICFSILPSVCLSVCLSTFTVQLRWFFKIPPNRWGWFFSPPRIFWYPTPIPTGADFSSTAFPPSSLCKTTHLPVELCGEQKFILASWQWKISDVRMIDSSEFFQVCMGRKSEPLFC